jgi:hypothetical protein
MYTGKSNQNNEPEFCSSVLKMESEAKLFAISR